MSKIAPANIIIYGKSYCPYCTKAQTFFDERNIPYDYFDVGVDEIKYDEMQTVTKGKARTVPQIIIHGQPIGGYDNLVALDASGELATLLNLDSGDLND